MTCALCHQPKPLCDSHIIPEFFYRGAYDEKHRALELTRDRGTERLVQKGYREPLFCADCENRFSRYETYFKRAWYDESRLPTRLDTPEHRVTGLDYQLTRLLHLSIIWRASVSSHSMFRSVRLGPHESILRAMLLTDNPGSHDRYHWVAQILVLDGPVLDGFIMEPTVRKHGPRHVYTFTYGGCAWHFVISSEPVRDWLPLALQHDGSQILLRQQLTKDRRVLDFLVDFLRRQGAA